VLRAEREPWLAIDPAPVVGERAFDAASLLRDRAVAAARRLDAVSAQLGLDRERVRLWGIVVALVWGISGAKLERDLVDCARVLAAAAT
jgi:streptomycin 6-kinase